MNNDIIVSLLALIGTIVGSCSGIIISNKLTNYRIAKLEEKVDKHNTVLERVFLLEQRQDGHAQGLSEVDRRVDKIDEKFSEAEKDIAVLKEKIDAHYSAN